MLDELLEIVNEDDEVVGLAPRWQCHSDPAFMHRTVHVLIFTSKSNLVLQLRSMTKDIAPGKWDTSVGGHVCPGRDPDLHHRRSEPPLGHV